jgi:hypothetical protein
VDIVREASQATFASQAPNPFAMFGFLLALIPGFATVIRLAQ